jgi:hypothetical protein
VNWSRGRINRGRDFLVELADLAVADLGGYQFSLDSRCIAALAGLGTLINTGDEPGP